LSSQLRSPRLSATFQGVITRTRLRPSAWKRASEKTSGFWSPRPTVTVAAFVAAGTAVRARASRVVRRVSLRVIEFIHSMLRRSAEYLESLDSAP